MSYKEFVKLRIDVPNSEKEPFCPFGCAYCNEAYSEKCYKCAMSREDYEEYDYDQF